MIVYAYIIVQYLTKHNDIFLCRSRRLYQDILKTWRVRRHTVGANRRVLTIRFRPTSPRNQSQRRQKTLPAVQTATRIRNTQPEVNCRLRTSQRRHPSSRNPYLKCHVTTFHRLHIMLLFRAPGCRSQDRTDNNYRLTTRCNCCSRSRPPVILLSAVHPLTCRHIQTLTANRTAAMLLSLALSSGFAESSSDLSLSYWQVGKDVHCTRMNE